MVWKEVASALMSNYVNEHEIWLCVGISFHALKEGKIKDYKKIFSSAPFFFDYCYTNMCDRNRSILMSFTLNPSIEHKAPVLEGQDITALWGSYTFKPNN